MLGHSLVYCTSLGRPGLKKKYAVVMGSALPSAAGLSGIPTGQRLSDRHRYFREREGCLSERCVSNSSDYLFPSYSYSTLSADACCVFKMIQQSKLMRFSSINRMPPLWEGKKFYFLLSLLVPVSGKRKRLDCVPALLPDVKSRSPGTPSVNP